MNNKVENFVSQTGQLRVVSTCDSFAVAGSVLGLNGCFCSHLVPVCLFFSFRKSFVVIVVL